MADGQPGTDLTDRIREFRARADFGFFGRAPFARRRFSSAAGQRIFAAHKEKICQRSRALLEAFCAPGRP